jgi:hypothetical protein
MNRSRRSPVKDPIWSEGGAEPLHGRSLFTWAEAVSNGVSDNNSDSGKFKSPAAQSARWWRHGSSGDMPSLAAAAIIEACRRPLDVDHVHTVAERVGGLRSLPDLNEMLNYIRWGGPTNTDRLCELARWLCRFGTESGHVIAGIGILGIAGRPRDQFLLLKLGVLAQLTLFVVNALTNLLRDASHPIFLLAQQVTGSSRMDCVHELSGTIDPEIRDWILRSAWDPENSVDSASFECVTAGGLAAALQGQIDEELLDRAGSLLSDLTRSQERTLYDYNSAYLTTELYLTEMLGATLTLQRLAEVSTIGEYFERWPEGNYRFPATECVRLRGLVHDIFARPESRSIVEEARLNTEFGCFSNFVQTATRVGIDPLPLIRERLESDSSNPYSSYFWQILMFSANEDSIGELLEFADRVLDFEDLPAGANSSFEAVIRTLVRFPGKGWPAIKLALVNESPHVRGIAVYVLERWPLDVRPSELPALLVAIAETETDARLRSNIRDLLGSSTVRRIGAG